MQLVCQCFGRFCILGILASFRQTSVINVLSDNVIPYRQTSIINVLSDNLKFPFPVDKSDDSSACCRIYNDFNVLSI